MAVAYISADTSPTFRQESDIARTEINYMSSLFCYAPYNIIETHLTENNVCICSIFREYFFFHRYKLLPRVKTLYRDFVITIIGQHKSGEKVTHTRLIGHTYG